MFSRRGGFIISCLLVGLCYVNSLPNDFVFDDAPIVSSNPVIRTISPIQFLKSPYWTQQQYLGIYRPFVILSLSIDYAVWKHWAPGFRLSNLALHAVNGFLVFLLCESLLGSGIVPFAAMLVYVAHPVHTEAVTTIVGRSELFSACFFLGAWLLFRRGRTFWASVVFLLALLSKENAIVLPAVLALDLFLFPSPSGRGGRAAPGEGHSSDPNPETLTLPSLEASPYRARASRPRGTGWIRLVPISCIALAYLSLRFYVLGGFGIPASAQYMGGRLTYFDRLLTSGRVFIKYLEIVLYPLNLAGDYDFNAIPIARVTDWDAWAGLLLVGAIIAAAVYFCRRGNSAVTFGLCFALITLIPSSNWIFPISVLMAERFLYLPLVGVALVAAVSFSELNDHRLRRLIGIGSLVTAVVLCNSHDYIRRDDFTFFKNMVRVVPNSAKARLGYGFALIKAGRNDEAAHELEAGLRIIPDYPELLATLALAKMTSTSCVNAWPLLKQALEIDPNHADTHRRMGDCYFKEGRIPEAESMYRQAAESIPNPDAMLYFMWGRSLEIMGESAKAIAAYDRAALIEPENLFFQQKLSALGAKQSVPQAHK
jgi:tetratricopeptide (TPR) repeat protein